MEPTMKSLQEELLSLDTQLKAALAKSDEDKATYGVELGQRTEEIKKLNDAMDALEEKIAALTAKVAAPGVADDEKGKDDERHKSVMDNYIRFGNEALSPEDLKFIKDKTKMYSKGLTENVKPTAGYLVRPEQANEIIMGITEYSPIRQIADVQTISTSSWEGPKETGKDVAVWVSETGTRPESVGAAYGMEKIPVHETSMRKSISNALSEDSFVNMESVVNAGFIRGFATLEGAALVGGDGVGKPEGFLINAAVLAAATNSGTANVISADDFSNMLYGVKASATSGLKEGYHNNATWVFHRTTLGKVRRLKDGQGNYLWLAGLQGGVPNTILDRPYLLATDMPVISTGNEAVALGDFRAGYRIVDRIGITMQRVVDTVTMDEGGFRLYARKRVGGQVVLAEAIKLLTIA